MPTLDYFTLTHTHIDNIYKVYGYQNGVKVVPFFIWKNGNSIKYLTRSVGGKTKFPLNTHLLERIALKHTV